MLLDTCAITSSFVSLGGESIGNFPYFFSFLSFYTACFCDLDHLEVIPDTSSVENRPDYRIIGLLMTSKTDMFSSCIL